MSKEVDEAIDALKQDIYNLKDFLTDTEKEKWQQTIDTVLNYIEELEIYKDELKKVNKALNLEEGTIAPYTSDIIESLKRCVTQFQNDALNSIPKQKIRDKIEELEEEDLEIYDTDSEDLVIAKYEERAVLDFAQELLNEEGNKNV